MNDIFLREWRLYRRSAFRAPFAGEPPAGEAEFDSPVKPGDIRVFADSNRPFVALVVEDRGLSGRRIVPVSPFTAPASSREMLLGERVLQLWNATVASRRFTDRSWLVDQVAGDEVAKVLAALPAAHPGRVAAGDDVLARYEREFLVTGGGFVPFVSRRREAARPFWQHGGWKIAASLLVCIGAFYFIIGGGQDGLRRWSEGHVRAMCFSAEDSVELLD
ncbi:MAG: hypothetical protein IJI73_04720, partial [Kiritimatiellae bacterium]|nr:hypothetical protein [Kiritimatiellia bacterium]